MFCQMSLNIRNWQYWNQLCGNIWSWKKPLTLQIRHDTFTWTPQYDVKFLRKLGPTSKRKCLYGVVVLNLVKDSSDFETWLYQCFLEMKSHFLQWKTPLLTNFQGGQNDLLFSKGHVDGFGDTSDVSLCDYQWCQFCVKLPNPKTKTHMEKSVCKW